MDQHEGDMTDWPDDVPKPDGEVLDVTCSDCRATTRATYALPWVEGVAVTCPCGSRRVTPYLVEYTHALLRALTSTGGRSQEARPDGQQRTPRPR